jgi:hypothetical protein
MGERGEGIEIGTNCQVEGAELERQAISCQALPKFPATKLTNNH